MTIHSLKSIVLVLSFIVLADRVYAVNLDFEQLNWYGSASTTPDSSWGRVSLDFSGYSDIEYFNLNVNGNWVVQNMGLESLYGTGVVQDISTFFDLGVSNGANVPTLNYYYSIDASPQTLMPTGSLMQTAVADLDYQIGGEDGIDTGSPGPVDRGSDGASPVAKHGELKNIDKFVNQEQKNGECVPGAISNSLKYLKATGKINFDDSIDGVKKWTPWTDGPPPGTSPGWWNDKKTYLEKKGMTVRFVEANQANPANPLTQQQVDDLISQLKDGQDIEMRLAGHAEDLVGLEVKEDGSIELSLYDDNQKGDGADKMHKSKIVNGKVDGMTLDRFIIECPEPAISVYIAIAAVYCLVHFYRKRRSTC